MSVDTTQRTDDLMQKRWDRLADILDFRGEEREAFYKRMAAKDSREPGEPYNYAIQGMRVEVFYRFDLDYQAMLHDISTFFAAEHPPDDDGSTFCINSITFVSRVEASNDALFDLNSTVCLRAEVVWSPVE